MYSFCTGQELVSLLPPLLQTAESDEVRLFLGTPCSPQLPPGSSLPGRTAGTGHGALSLSPSTHDRTKLLILELLQAVVETPQGSQGPFDEVHRVPEGEDFWDLLQGTPGTSSQKLSPCSPAVAAQAW